MSSCCWRSSTMTATNGMYVVTLRCLDFSLFRKVIKHCYIKYSCFFCLWNSSCRAVDQYLVRREWQAREGLEPGKLNMVSISVEKILLPPLHVKLGLMKQFVRALNTAGAAIQHIRQMFPLLPDAKVSGLKLRWHITIWRTKCRLFTNVHR